MTSPNYETISISEPLIADTQEQEEDHRTPNQATMAGPQLSQSTHKNLVAAFLAFTAIMGYMAATSGGGWSFFSYHPFLMVTGFIGMMGSAAVTKKLGGYTNTKVCMCMRESYFPMYPTLTVSFGNLFSAGYEL